MDLLDGTDAPTRSVRLQFSDGMSTELPAHLIQHCPLVQTAMSLDKTCTTVPLAVTSTAFEIVRRFLQFLHDHPDVPPLRTYIEFEECTTEVIQEYFSAYSAFEPNPMQYFTQMEGVKEYVVAANYLDISRMTEYFAAVIAWKIKLVWNESGNRLHPDVTRRIRHILEPDYDDTNAAN